MKKIVILFLSIFLLNLVSATQCQLSLSMINQDPYPAVQGDYVKLVFQLEGIENPQCGTIIVELLEKYPISFDPEESPRVIVQSGTFTKDYSSYLTVPYKVRVDNDALDGDNPLEVSYSYDEGAGSSSTQTKQFNLNIKDVRADFEIHVKNYNLATNTIEFEILNIGENDIEALTVEIPEQENVDIRGSNKNIVGDLDSNDYTTADFEAVAQDGEITLNLFYTDLIGVRRQTQETVSFTKSPFEKQASNQSGSSAGTYIFILIIVGAIAYYIYRRIKKKKQQAHLHHLQHNK